MTEPVHISEVFDQYWSAALRGDVITRDALAHVASMRWVLRERAAAGLDSPPEVIEALRAGDINSMFDPRRFIDIDTWTRYVEVDEATDILLTVRMAEDDEALKEAISDALVAGIDLGAVERAVLERSHG